MKVTNEQPKKGDLILIEIGVHSGKYIIGKVDNYHAQETGGDVIYYFQQMWHHHRNEHWYGMTTDCIGAGQCRKIVFDDDQA